MVEKTTDNDWTLREQYWRRRLGRIRLGAEPVEEQVAKYRRATWLVTGVSLGLAAIFVALFSAFRRPDIGLILAGILFLPVVALAWLDDAMTKVRVARYLAEERAHRDQQAASGRT
ncbi:hypothetical protein [Singulisphaera sp. PoT]|uniref:hypothetical protein n=1 Tax=Singulisphaera sp. PoT TaxID=3411797 RepID=UPI003BF4BEE2